jgi:hypothetical protein
VFVTAEVPFATDVVVHSLKQNTALPKTFTSWSITLEKEAP